MAISMSGGAETPMSDINTTPLVDVMLVLLIIFLIAVPVAIQTIEKLEIPVRKLLLGWPLEKAASRESMKNPQSIDFFLNYVATTDDFVVPEYKK